MRVGKIERDLIVDKGSVVKHGRMLQMDRRAALDRRERSTADADLTLVFERHLQRMGFGQSPVAAERVIGDNSQAGGVALYLIDIRIIERTCLDRGDVLVELE